MRALPTQRVRRSTSRRRLRYLSSRSFVGNSHRFGLIARYPAGKQSITGYIYEPWHLRYVGADLAGRLYDSGQSLEEYFGITSSY